MLRPGNGARQPAGSGHESAISTGLQKATLLVLMNSTTRSVRLGLACHPDTPTHAIQGVETVVGTAPGGGITLAFALEGDISRLRIPEPVLSRRADGLWRHTCFEVFAMAGDGPGYREFNFSPSGEWAVYMFRGYRDGGKPGGELAPAIRVRRTEDRLELAAQICQDVLPSGRQLRLGLSAVVEETGGVRSCWALRHPAGKPDFHHTDAFALQLVLP